MSQVNSNSRGSAEDKHKKVNYYDEMMMVCESVCVCEKSICVKGEGGMGG